MTIGLCMIVKNEEEVLGRCLQSVKKVCDEIVIVDTGSSDNTMNIALNFGAKVYSFPWNFDFSAARNFSFSLSSADYILWLDADDIITEENQKKLLDLKKTMDSTVDSYLLRYDTAFDEYGNATSYFFRERIVRRNANFLWVGPVHETICINSNSQRCDITITHLRSHNERRGRNLFIFAHSFAHGMMPDERQKYYFARELSDSGLYDTAASVFEDFLLGNGWVEDKIGACRALAFCYNKLQNRNKRLSALFRSFDFAPPRPEICCDLGLLYVEEKIGIKLFFGLNWLSINPLINKALSAPITADFSPAFGSAFATTASEIIKKHLNSMNGPVLLNLSIKVICIINFTFNHCFIIMEILYERFLQKRILRML